MENSDLTLILVMPPQAGLLGGFATGLISIANFVRRRLDSIQLQLLDLSSDSIALVQSAVLRKGIRFAKHTIVGITTTTASYQAALSVASAFKSLTLPGVEFTVILGGHHASADAETVLRTHHNTIDYIVVGEGEVPMVEFLRNFPNVCSTPGLAFLHKGAFHQNPTPALLNEKELDSIPMIFEDSGVMGTPGKFGHVTYVSARGCPLKCAFCSVSNQRIRAKSISHVVTEIRQMVDLGFSPIAIEDNFFAHTPQRTNELCEALAKLRRAGVKFTWDCQTRIESMDRPGLVELMQRAGCEAVYLGVESVNCDQLRYLNKTPNPERYLERLRLKVVPSLLESDIKCYINLQFGLPRETTEHHINTKNILRELGHAAAKVGKKITIFPQLHVIYPGTHHFETGWRNNTFSRDIFESFTAWEAEQAPVLNWLGKHFAHGTGGIPIGILRPEPLRLGNFAEGVEATMDTAAVMRIDTILTDIDDLEGIQLFKYGKYLVGEAEHSFSNGSAKMRALPRIRHQTDVSIVPSR